MKILNYTLNQKIKNIKYENNNYLCISVDDNKFIDARIKNQIILND